MTYQEIVVEIEKLPLNQQLSLLETLARLISHQTGRSPAPADSLQRVRGMLKPAGTTPTDAELANDYTEYLLRKYA